MREDGRPLSHGRLFDSVLFFANGFELVLGAVVRLYLRRVRFASFGFVRTLPREKHDFTRGGCTLPPRYGTVFFPCVDFMLPPV